MEKNKEMVQTNFEDADHYKIVFLARSCFIFSFFDPSEPTSVIYSLYHFQSLDFLPVFHWSSLTLRSNVYVYAGVK